LGLPSGLLPSGLPTKILDGDGDDDDDDDDDDGRH
jgi:hypothetical protein